LTKHLSTYGYEIEKLGPIGRTQLRLRSINLEVIT